MAASALTLVRGREAHLANLMTSLDRQTRRPDELVIAWMQDAPHEDLPEIAIPVRHVVVPGDPMPLAGARNRAAEAARGETLIFLDVDCVASPTLVESYVGAAASHSHALFLGEVLYLPAGAIDGPLDFARLDARGQVHPSKPAIPALGVRREPNAGELWGLSFALAREDYFAIGGMDESFIGYGGEETDFAARLSGSGIDFYWTAGARAYHQHHPVHVPPLHQFDHILRNAALFHARHGRWCMDYWLGQFRQAGLIDWRDEDRDIRVLRRPDPAEIAAALQPGERLFS
ncbi:galactosyltransferase-related protein [Aureimonas sp. AU12]|uniref:galactosyltransferase-related protein n=1 Tax=Aureimonas sp. AU12 TaxID=1638161 RepID=UPI000780802B|nr:galactosyltransferase-related protein [Aureimonas sp. AU12]